MSNKGLAALATSTPWRKSVFDIACATLALAVAVGIYRGYRGGLWINRSLPSLGGLDARVTSFAAAHPVPNWVRFSLPDALWQYAYAATMLAVWRGEPWHTKKIAAVSAPIVLGALVELGQAAHVVPGTFDVVDLLASFVAGIAAVVIHGGATRKTTEAAPVP